MSENYSKWAACIVYYENSDSLENLLKDLDSQTLKPNEIFVVDNNSIHEPNILSGPIKINLLKLDKNLGFGAAANFGVKKAIENNYLNLILFSQDVELEHDTCEKLIKAVNKFSGVAFPTMSNRVNKTIFSKGGVINYLTGSIRLITKQVPQKIFYVF